MLKNLRRVDIVSVDYLYGVEYIGKLKTAERISTTGPVILVIIPFDFVDIFLTVFYKISFLPRGNMFR